METETMIAQLERVIYLMRRQSCRSGLRRHHGLSDSVHQLMHIIVAHYGETNQPLTVTQIAQKMSITVAAASQLLDLPERKRIILRTQSPVDRRVVNVLLSKKGRRLVALFHKVHRSHDDPMRGLISFLGAKDARELTRILERVEVFLADQTGQKR